MRMFTVAAGVALLVLLPAGFSSLNAGMGLPPVYQLLLLKKDKPAAVGLSDVQKQFVATQGYPQQFVKSFGVENGQPITNEIWTYMTTGSVESFVNGRYRPEKALTVSGTYSAGELHPEAYQAFDTPAEIQARHGTPLQIIERQIWNGPITIYIYSNVLFHFNNGRLDTVFYSIQPPSGPQ